MERIPLEKSYYSYHFNALKFMGAWVVDPSNPVVLNLYSGYKTVMTVFAATGCFSLFTDFYLVMGDFKKMTWNLCVSTLFTGGLLKNIYSIHRSSVINGLRIKLHRDACLRKTEEDDALDRLSLKELKYLRILFYGMAIVFVPIWLVSRYLSYFWGERDIPIPVRLPFNINYQNKVHYSYAFAGLATFGCLGLFFVLETEMGMFTILIQISREYKRLLNDVMRISTMYESCTTGSQLLTSNTCTQEINPELRKIKTKMMLKNCCKRQQQLIEYTKNFELSYSASLLLQTFVASVLVIVSAIQCMLEFGHISANLTYQMGYITIIILDLFLVCWYSSRIRGQCLKVGEEAYATLWYHMGPDIQRDICMIIMRSQRPPKITSGKVMEMNLHAFMLMMRNIYSWLALFQQLEFKVNS